MRTVVIYETFTDPIIFLVIEGDVTRFDGLYINAVGNDEALQDEFCYMLYDELSGAETKLLKDARKTFPIDEVKNGASVIVAGFLP
jgi:hypothetical protein